MTATMTELGQHARVISPYTMAYPEPLMLKQGEHVAIIAHDTQWPAYIWCTSASGKGGWVPERYLRIEGAEGWVLRDYSAQELTISTGDELTLLDEEGGWYWARNELGQYGWVPAEHVVRI